MFHELVKASGKRGVLELATLTKKLPEEAKKLIAGVTSPMEAWKISEVRDGDKKIIVLSAIHKLESLRRPQSPAHNRVESSVTAVRTARTCLRAVGDKQQLFASCFTIGKLVNKLADNTQTRWFY